MPDDMTLRMIRLDGLAFAKTSCYSTVAPSIGGDIARLMDWHYRFVDITVLPSSSDEA